MKKKYSKKISIYILVSTIVGVCFSGCGESDKADILTEPIEQKIITVLASEAMICDADIELAEKFKQETGIEVEIQTVPALKYENVLTTGLQLGEGPDIFVGEYGNELEYFKYEKYALNLSGEKWVENYSDWMIDQTNYKGKVIGFTAWEGDVRAMIYNKDLFAKYNIEVPVDYRSFKEACETLMENEIIPVYFMGSEEWYYRTVFDGAVNIETKEPGTYAKINKNEMTYSQSKEALKFLNNLNDSMQCGYFGEKIFENTLPAGIEALANGEYAMCFAGASYLNNILSVDGVSADSFGVFPCPYTDDMSTITMIAPGITKVINKDSKNIELCKQYFDFLAREENLRMFCEGRMDELKLELVEGATDTCPKCYVELVENTEIKRESAPSVVIKYHKSAKSLGENIRSMFAGEMTAEQVLNVLDWERKQSADSMIK